MPTQPNLSPVVLVVDDEPDFLKLILRILRRQIPGCTLIGVTSPIEALAHLEQQPIALLMTDQRMPAMSGTELARRFKQQAPQTSVLLVSGDIFPHSMDPSIDGYLPKPFDLAQITQVVQRMLNGVLAPLPAGSLALAAGA